MILYEYPCNERVRILLRLESLFDRLFFFAQGEDARHHQVAMGSMFDILECLDRTDIKGSVMQDLDRQRQALLVLRGHASVDQAGLEKTLADIEQAIAALASQGKIGQALRDNDWLTSLRGRLSVPGGATQFEMPSYYAWQQKPIEQRRASLRDWVAVILPVFQSLSLCLRLLRQSGSMTDAEAPQGAYQHMLGGKVQQLVRVQVDEVHGVFPEISANKYMIWIRFSCQDGEMKPQQVTRTIPFRIALCSF
ncbi:MAG: cell division protein ZapD [Corticimicrobacter sp.]|uniref:cell division protein ZapD n=1 Tax=Corticimicrobacter sp. TaxID=2678536 RepID=UPI0032DBC33C